MDKERRGSRGRRYRREEKRESRGRGAKRERERRWERRGGAIVDFGGRSGAPCFPSVRSQFQSRAPSLLRESANRKPGVVVIETITSWSIEKTEPIRGSQQSDRSKRNDELFRKMWQKGLDGAIDPIAHRSISIAMLSSIRLLNRLFPRDMNACDTCLVTRLNENHPAEDDRWSIFANVVGYSGQIDLAI